MGCLFAPRSKYKDTNSANHEHSARCWRLLYTERT